MVCLCLAMLSVLAASVSAYSYSSSYNSTGAEVVEELISKTNASRRLSEYGERIVNQALSPVTIRVNPQTSLYVQAGQTTTLNFDITNNNNWNSFFDFYCSALTSTIQSIQPYERWIAGLDTVTVKVVVRVASTATNTADTVTFTAVTYSSFGDSPTYSKTYLFFGQQVNDNSSPDVSYTINGDCGTSNTPSTCSGATWGFQANIQDKQSGLLSVVTVPPGFEFTSDFTAGTRDQVTGRYSSSCCTNKVDLIATDLNGNQYRTSIDIYNVWLSAGAIVAIVLGSLLLLLLIVLCCCAIGWCIRRRRKTSTFTMHS